jgi:hypothetical protein
VAPARARARAEDAAVSSVARLAAEAMAVDKARRALKGEKRRAAAGGSGGGDR